MSSSSLHFLVRFAEKAIFVDSVEGIRETCGVGVEIEVSLHDYRVVRVIYINVLFGI